MMEWYLVVTIALFGFQFVAADYPNEGCFWTGNCVNEWRGGCGEGRVTVAKSENCAGLCRAPQYQPCPLFTTHFQCCNHEKPQVSKICPRCDRRVDFGKAYLCCEDCSEPIITDRDSGEGFCMNGAKLVITLKPIEVYKATAGAWGNCSSTCGGGLRSRQLACRRVDPASGHPIGPPVSEDRCDDAPPAQEACNLHACPKPAPKQHRTKHNPKPQPTPKPKPQPQPQAASAKRSAEQVRPRGHGGISGGLLAALLSFLGVALLGGAALGGYVYYQRRQSSEQGFVYVMLEGYN